MPTHCGIDEAGRGPLAGRVYAAAVILPDVYELPGLNDSKKLTSKQRNRLATLIQAAAISCTVAWAEVWEIEDLGIDQACFLAMRRAFDGLEPKPDEALTDGLRPPALSVPARAIVKGDSLIPAISAASILAKTARDDYMHLMDARYPGYGFARHKGYGTAAHFSALDAKGVCEIHRESFLVKWRTRRTSNTQPYISEAVTMPNTGAQGEDIACDFLTSQGYQIIARNHRSPWGEIDIIAKKGDTLVFAEVKTRKPNAMVGAAESVTPAKQARLRKTAELYLQEHPAALQPRFDVITIVLSPNKPPQIGHIENAF